VGGVERDKGGNGEWEKESDVFYLGLYRGLRMDGGNMREGHPSRKARWELQDGKAPREQV
jgi:hypothetical protein